MAKTNLIIELDVQKGVGRELFDSIRDAASKCSGVKGVGTVKVQEDTAAPEIAIIVHGGLVQGVRANFKAGVEVYDIDDMEETMTRDLAFQTMEKDTKHLKNHIY